MNAQIFTQMAAAFIAGVTAMNLFIHFLQLAACKLKSCSIIGREQTREKKSFRFGMKRKIYAAAPCAGKAM